MSYFVTLCKGGGSLNPSPEVSTTLFSEAFPKLVTTAFSLKRTVYVIMYPRSPRTITREIVIRIGVRTWGVLLWRCLVGLLRVVDEIALADQVGVTCGFVVCDFKIVERGDDDPRFG